MWQITRPTRQQKDPYQIPKRVWYVLSRIVRISGRMSRELWKMNDVVNNAVKYAVEGQAVDHEWIIKNREYLEEELMKDMRQNGFVPVLDMSPGLIVSYKESEDLFDYTIEAMAFEVGYEKAQDIMGIMASEGLIIGNNAESVSIARL